MSDNEELSYDFGLTKKHQAKKSKKSPSKKSSHSKKKSHTKKRSHSKKKSPVKKSHSKKASPLKKSPSTVGSYAQVWHGSAIKTSGGLHKKDLTKNKHGNIVSKRKMKVGLARWRSLSAAKKQSIKTILKKGRALSSKKH